VAVIVVRRARHLSLVDIRERGKHTRHERPIGVGADRSDSVRGGGRAESGSEDIIPRSVEREDVLGAVPSRGFPGLLVEHEVVYRKAGKRIARHRCSDNMNRSHLHPPCLLEPQAAISPIAHPATLAITQSRPLIGSRYRGRCVLWTVAKVFAVGAGAASPNVRGRCWDARGAGPRPRRVVLLNGAGLRSSVTATARVRPAA
jgi:hypothetical protein